MKNTYYTSTALVDRLYNASQRRNRPVMFLVGSPLSLPDQDGGHGVPGVSGMIDLIREEFKGSSAEAEFAQLLDGEPANRYQEAFTFLHGRQGQDDVNRIVRTAVWRALDANNLPPHLSKKSPQDADAAICQALEDTVEAWVLPRAVDMLGNLLATYSETFGRAVLTTNFDPLIEVSVSKHRGQFFRTVLHDDGNLGQTVAKGTHIVHLHGYWYGSDTLHTPQQLVQSRPQLSKSLARVVEASTLVVLGYSGWDDVVTRTLVELLSDSDSTPDIIWAFHAEDATTIEASNERLLALLAPGIGRGRVSLYRGIDCCSLLNEIYQKLRLSDPAASGPTGGPRVIPVTRDDSDGGIGQGQVHIQPIQSLKKPTPIKQRKHYPKSSYSERLTHPEHDRISKHCSAAWVKKVIFSQHPLLPKTPSSTGPQDYAPTILKHVLPHAASAMSYGRLIPTEISPLWMPCSRRVMATQTKRFVFCGIVTTPILELLCLLY